MYFRIRGKDRLALAATVFLLMVSGCFRSAALKELSLEEALRQRVMAYWKFRINEELDKSYSYEHPLYRKQTPITGYVRRYSSPLIRLNSYEITDISLKDADRAAVGLKLNETLKIPGAKPFTHDTILEEQWVKVEGTWYHLIKETHQGAIPEEKKGGDVRD